MYKIIYGIMIVGALFLTGCADAGERSECGIW